MRADMHSLTFAFIYSGLVSRGRSCAFLYNLWQISQAGAARHAEPARSVGLGLCFRRIGPLEHTPARLDKYTKYRMNQRLRLSLASDAG